MAPTPEATNLGYHKMWDAAAIDSNRTSEISKFCDQIEAHWSTYQAIADKAGVWPEMIAVIHYRESALNFRTHLHCGDPLTARTVHVPKGRPATGSPPFTFEESALDALTMAPHALNKIKTWSVERLLYELEKYNGWGYLKKGNSPYLWAATNQYHGGKYVADGVYDPGAWDKQLGCVALLKELGRRRADVAGRLANRQPEPPPEVVQEHAKEQTKEAAGGAVVAGTGGAVVATTGTVTKTHVEVPAQKDAPVKHFAIQYGAPLLVFIGIIAISLAFIKYGEKLREAAEELKQRWS